jgi:hypothetical protein
LQIDLLMGNFAKNYDLAVVYRENGQTERAEALLTEL